MTASLRSSLCFSGTVLKGSKTFVKKCVKMQTMYIFYLMRHKFWVMYFCFKHGLFWQGIVHDWDKLLPSMLYTYARHYPMIRRKRNTDGCYNPLEAPPDYQRAMLEHFNRSKHHWQHWIMANGVVYQPLDIPEKYIREMICDWAGAGRTRQGKAWHKGKVREFFENTRARMVFSEESIRLIQKNLDEMGY